MKSNKKKIARIIDDIECPHNAGSLAAAVAFYWPTIKAALEFYAKNDQPVKRNLPQSY